MSEARPTSWRSPDGSLQKVEAVILPEFARIMGSGGFDYPSLDMKKGICVAGLVKFANILHGLMLVDPRGGYFRQQDMQSVVLRLALQQQFLDVFKSWCASAQVGGVAQGATRVAYMVRVMLSHAREKKVSMA